MRVSKWTDKRLRVGWTIRLKNGKLARITWVSENGQAYMAQVLETQPEPEQ